MTELVEFLLARIDEDEAVARAAIEWQRGDDRPRIENGHGGVDDADGGGMAGYVGDDVAPHIVRWHPARVVAECEAKRRIVEWLSDRCRVPKGELPRNIVLGTSDDGSFYAVIDGERIGHAEYSQRFTTPNPKPLRSLAAPYADHPDYREEWRP